MRDHELAGFPECSLGRSFRLGAEVLLTHAFLLRSTCPDLTVILKGHKEGDPYETLAVFEGATKVYRDYIRCIYIYNIYV